MSILQLEVGDSTLAPVEKKVFKPLPPRKVSRQKPVEISDDTTPKNYCSRYCTSMCYVKSQAFTEDERIKLAGFKKSRKIETKNNLLSHLRAQQNILPVESDSIVFGGHAFCIPAFSKLAGISTFLLKKVTAHIGRGFTENFSHEKTRLPNLHMNSIRLDPSVNL